VASLQVRAVSAGVVQDLSVEEGQWVTPGTTLARVVLPDRLKAVLRIPEAQARDLVVGQRAVVDLRSDTIVGRVARIDPASQGATVAVDITFDGAPLPRGARPDLGVEGIIEITRLERTRFVGRPAQVQGGSAATVYRVEGDYAERVPVRFGRLSVDAVQVLDGLTPGDVIILADLPSVGNAQRIHIE
jgi:multidrug efflux pump subunit AcrA (membrane-fusion protein)